MKSRSLYLVMAVMLLATGSCKNWSQTAKGGTIGAGSGAVVGGVIGKMAGNTAIGAIVGAAVGGAAGASIGHYMDKQAKEIQQDIQGAQVERVGEGIKITFPAGILFDVNSSDLKPNAEQNIQTLTRTLQKYKDTNILVEGHTDNTGTDQYNMDLSNRRADEVVTFAKTQGIDGSRFSTVGYGESQPVSDNNTMEGRLENRRVEVAIFANDKLKKAAKRGDI